MVGNTTTSGQPHSTANAENSNQNLTLNPIGNKSKMKIALLFTFIVPISFSDSTARFKNVHKEMHAANDKYNTCPLCKEYSKHLHTHHMTKHSKREFFLSRISPDMMEVAVAGTQQVLTAGGIYLASCLFCNKQCTFSRRTWLEHFADHMAKYLYECHKCHEKCNRNNQHKLHCSGELVQFQNVEMKDGDDKFYAFACKQCNYVQFERKQIYAHLENEHNLKDTNKFVEYTQEITLLNPKLKNRVSKRRYSSITIQQSSDGEREDGEPDAKEVCNNDNIEFHATNDQYKKACILCGKKWAKLVNHMVKCHSNYEIYISRPSPNILKRIKSNQSNSQIASKQSKQMIELRINNMPRTKSPLHQPKVYCIFCEDYRRLEKQFCIEHLTVHTGEYQYVCSGCNKKVSYPAHRCVHNGDVDKIQQFGWENNSVYGFMCNLCNYTQLSENRVIEHVAKQHHIDQSIVCQNYCKTNLLVFTEQPNKLKPNVPATAERDRNVSTPPPIVNLPFTSSCDTNAQNLNKPFVDGRTMAQLRSSCISVDMYRSFRKQTQTLPYTYFDPFTGQTLGYCLFCDDYVPGDRKNWIIHLLRHTNEPLYECQDCNEHFFSKRYHTNLKGCPSQMITQLFEVWQSKGYIRGCMCLYEYDINGVRRKPCKFVQINKGHIIEHLKVHHRIDPPLVGRDFVNISMFHFKPNPIDTVNHLNYKNWTANLTPYAMETAVNNLPLATFIDNKYEVFCLFCNDVLTSVNRTNWIVHMTKHTKELMFDCSSCRQLSATADANCCDRTKLKQIHFFAYENNCLYGFACNIQNCNYVQLSEKNMLEHVLKSHHGQAIARNTYSSIKLIDFGDVDQSLIGIANLNSNVDTIEISD